jgi:hypothetical protein
MSRTVEWVALVLVVVGAINWASSAWRNSTWSQHCLADKPRH